MADVKIGKITHYYNHLSVGIVDVKKKLKVGDTIKIMGRGQDFTQTVSSLQLDHHEITEAKKGQTVGLKVDQKVKEGDEVVKV